MDGLAQDELLHQTDPGLEGQRINLTFRWIRQYAHGYPLSTFVACCLPSCAHGLSVQQTPVGHEVGLLWVSDHLFRIPDIGCFVAYIGPPF